MWRHSYKKLMPRQHQICIRCHRRLRRAVVLLLSHYDDVIMDAIASQITSLTIVYSIVYSGVNQRKHQSSASLAFVREIHRGPVNFPHKWPVTRKMFPFDDVIMMSLKVTFSLLTRNCIEYSNLHKYTTHETVNALMLRCEHNLLRSRCCFDWSRRIIGDVCTYGSSWN